ncbi:hypothetical protein CLU79DRAFT_758324 [Phycomyces nitens]|nr:hypothetical protein CLU79DRAFT_758324 [Phycomyces nitens]
MPHAKEDATLTLHIDSSFTGVMTGFANDESEGCVLSGTCVATIHRPVKVRRLLVWFEGRCKVTLKSTNYGMPNPETSERRTLFTKDARFLGDDGQVQTLLPGEHTYPFRFELPANLPSSFRGKRGYIRYRLQAAIYRPMFANNITVVKEICLRRCLMDDLVPIADTLETVHGKINTNKLTYSATAPNMVYREGGLIRLNVAMSVVKPETQTVRSVTCALRERVQYRTTDQQSSTVLHKTDDLFPLGYSTFYPSKNADYNPAEKHDYNAVFRVCPRVNIDTTCRLLKVTHSVIVNIVVEDTAPKEDGHETEDDMAYYTSEDERLSAKHFESSIPSPPTSRPTSPSLSRSSSSSSISSIFRRSTSFHIHHTDHDQEPIEALQGIRRKSRKSRHHDEPSITMCSLEIPVIVTSREHVWDGDMPSPPAYATADAPPSYGLSIEQLPRAPTYADTTETSSTS